MILLYWIIISVKVFRKIAWVNKLIVSFAMTNSKRNSCNLYEIITAV